MSDDSNETPAVEAPASVTVTLAKPVKAHGEMVGVLTFRPPTTKEIIATGLPTLVIPDAAGDSIGIEVRQKIVARYVVLLAQVPLSTVESLDPGDWSRCTGAVMNFFGAGDGA